MLSSRRQRGLEAKNFGFGLNLEPMALASTLAFGSQLLFGLSLTWFV